MEHNHKPNNGHMSFKSERDQVHDYYLSRGASREDLEFSDYDKWVTNMWNHHRIDMRIGSNMYNGPFAVFNDHLNGLPPESATDLERTHTDKARKITKPAESKPVDVNALSVFDEFADADPTDSDTFLSLNRARLLEEEGYPVTHTFMDEGDEYYPGHT